MRFIKGIKATKLMTAILLLINKIWENLIVSLVRKVSFWCLNILWFYLVEILVTKGKRLEVNSFNEHIKGFIYLAGLFLLFPCLSVNAQLIPDKSLRNESSTVNPSLSFFGKRFNWKWSYSQQESFSQFPRI